MIGLISCEPIRILPVLLLGPDELSAAILRFGALRPKTGDLVHTIIRAAHAGRATDRLSAAQLVGVGGRALSRRLREDGLPCVSLLLALGRLARLSELLALEGCTLYRAARLTGYPDSFTASNQMRRVLGIRPSALPDVDPAVLDSALERAVRGRFRARRGGLRG
jgi:AraC-like DNA-binding protein